MTIYYNFLGKLVFNHPTESRELNLLRVNIPTRGKKKNLKLFILFPVLKIILLQLTNYQSIRLHFVTISSLFHGRDISCNILVSKAHL